MNFEEGFRRIGVVVVFVALILGVLALIMGSPSLAISISGGVVLVGLGLLYAGAYVAKGFMKNTSESKDED